MSGKLFGQIVLLILIGIVMFMMVKCMSYNCPLMKRSAYCAKMKSMSQPMMPQQ